MMLDIEAKVIALFTQSGDIIPVHLRRDAVQEPIKMVALVTCTNKEVSFVSMPSEFFPNYSNIIVRTRCLLSKFY